MFCSVCFSLIALRVMVWLIVLMSLLCCVSIYVSFTVYNAALMYGRFFVFCFVRGFLINLAVFVGVVENPNWKTLSLAS